MVCCFSTTAPLHTHIHTHFRVPDLCGLGGPGAQGEGREEARARCGLEAGGGEGSQELRRVGWQEYTSGRGGWKEGREACVHACVC